MKFRFKFLIAIALLIVVGLSLSEFSWAQQVEKRAQESANTLMAFMNQPADKQIPASVLQEAQCIVVIPGLVKVSVAVGYKSGKGLAICRHDGTGEWGAPAFYNAKGPSVGISLGGESSDVVILAMNSNAYKKEMTPLQALLENNETPPALAVFTDAVKEFAPGK
jgi:SH3 domain-containing YSC84-like protein 1